MADYDIWSERLSTPDPNWHGPVGGTVVPKEPKGKGGNFDTRANPFAQMRSTLGVAPKVTECASLWSGVQCAVQAGCAVLVGQTRDGGALCITVLDGDERHRTYAADTGELEAAGQALMQMYT